MEKILTILLLLALEDSLQNESKQGTEKLT